MRVSHFLIHRTQQTSFNCTKEIYALTTRRASYVLSDTIDTQSY